MEQIAIETGGKQTVRYIDLSGHRYALDFDYLAFSYAETAYEKEFGVAVNVSEIIEDLLRSRARAVMAFAWGAMRSAGENITFREFAKLLKDYSVLSGITALVTDAVIDMMPAGEAEEGEEHSKNGRSRGGE